MAIRIEQRSSVNYNAPDATTGLPKLDQWLDFKDDAGETIASIYAPADGSTPTLSLDSTEVPTVQTVYSATVTLTDAQIKALPTTPVSIVGPVGAGRMMYMIPYGNPITYTAGDLSVGDTVSVPDVTAADIVLAFENSGSGNLTGGDAANEMQVTLLYTVIDV